DQRQFLDGERDDHAPVAVLFNGFSDRFESAELIQSADVREDRLGIVEAIHARAQQLLDAFGLDLAIADDSYLAHHGVAGLAAQIESPLAHDVVAEARFLQTWRRAARATATPAPELGQGGRRRQRQ